MPLAAILLPLIPSLVDGVIAVADAISAHDDTPDEIKAKLVQISLDLQAVVAKVRDVKLPGE